MCKDIELAFWLYLVSETPAKGKIHDIICIIQFL